MKFMRRAAGYGLLDHRRNEGISEELKVDPVRKKLTQYEQKGQIMLAGWKTSHTWNNSLTVDLSEEEEEELYNH